MADLPQNIRAERGLLGILLTDNDTLFSAGDLSKEDFAEPYNGELYLLIRDYIEAGRTATAATIMHDAQDAVIWGDLKASQYLTLLESESPPARFAGELARVVRDTALRSRVIRTAEDIARRARDAPVSVRADELRFQIDEAMSALFPSVQDMGLLRAADVGDGILNRLRTTEAAVGLPMGLAGVQDLMGAAMPGRLYMLGAASGGGKSALIVQIARNMALAGYRVLLDSLEMSAEETVERILSGRTGIEAPKIERGTVTQQEYQMLVDANNDDRAGELYIDQTSKLTVPMIRGRALRKQRLGGLDILFVDHIHYVSKADRKQSENEALDENLAGLKALARDLKIPVVCACHFTSTGLRDMEQWPHRRPKKGDLLFSATVERHADVIALLHRPEYFLRQAEPEPDARHYHEWVLRMSDQGEKGQKGVAELILAKRRGGKGYGIRRLYFDEARVTFTDNRPKQVVDDGFTF